MHLPRIAAFLVACVAGWAWAASAEAACCYFVPKTNYIQQPGQKVFITWDPARQIETFTVQPKFEGNSRDFGMVVPTPTQPKLDEMPRDFFKNLAVVSILTQREFPQSKLLPATAAADALKGAGKGKAGGKKGKGIPRYVPPPPTIKILEEGVVGQLDYKIIAADKSADLFQWLKINRYQYAGDEATLNFYVQKKWVFTVMKIDSMQMKKGKAELYAGDVAPMRFQFGSAKLVYPLKITQFSVKEKTDALFYVQAPFKVDLEKDFSYQLSYVPMLSAARNTLGTLPGRGTDWLAAIRGQIPELQARNRQLEYDFVPGQRPTSNSKGRVPTTMEWAHRLSAQDIAMLQGQAPYCEKVPNVDEGFTQDDINKADAAGKQRIYNTIRERLAKSAQDHPNGYLVRYVPPDDIKALQGLVGHLRADQWVTKFRKTFRRDEMNDDLVIIPARMAEENDFTEYTELLPTSPPQ